jgi:hypothetical protein
VSSIIARFSSGETRRTLRTWSGEVLPKTVQTAAPHSRSATRFGSSSAATPARRVAPNAVRTACDSARSRARWKNSASFGFEPGQPPSMKLTPRRSSRSAMRSLSSHESEMPSRWVPSRRVVS